MVVTLEEAVTELRALRHEMGDLQAAGGVVSMRACPTAAEGTATCRPRGKRERTRRTQLPTRLRSRAACYARGPTPDARHISNAPSTAAGSVPGTLTA